MPLWAIPQRHGAHGLQVPGPIHFVEKPSQKRFIRWITTGFWAQQVGFQTRQGKNEIAGLKPPGWIRRGIPHEIAVWAPKMEPW